MVEDTIFAPWRSYDDHADLMTIGMMPTRETTAPPLEVVAGALSSGSVDVLPYPHGGSATMCPELALRDSARFVGTHLPDLAVIALPLLRPLRLLRLVTLLNFLNRRAGDSLRGRVAVYVVGSTSLILFVSSLAALEAEREHEGSNITTFGDALWWAMTTVTTVGYGDRYPTTVTGRFVAAGLMLAGIALLGVVTASLATWLLAKIREVEQDVESVTQRDVEALTREVQALRAEVARLMPRDREALAPSGPSPNG